MNETMTAEQQKNFLSKFGLVASELPASKTGQIDEIIDGFMKLNIHILKSEKIQKYSVPFINKKAQKNKLPIKAVTRKNLVYLVNTKLA